MELTRPLPVTKPWVRTKAGRVQVDEIMPAVGDLVRAALAERGATQRDLTIKLDLAPSIVNGVINGRARVSLDLLATIAKALGYTLHVSFVPTADMPEPQAMPMHRRRYFQHAPILRIR